MKKSEYKKTIAILKDELNYLRGFYEGVKRGVNVNFSPTINQAPKKDFASGGFVSGLDNGTDESKEGVWKEDRKASIREALSNILNVSKGEVLRKTYDESCAKAYELNAELERLNQSPITDNDNFKQQPFNPEPVTEGKELTAQEVREHFEKVDKQYAENSNDVIEVVSQNFFAIVKEGKRQLFYNYGLDVNIIETINDLGIALRRGKQILSKPWVQR